MTPDWPHESHATSLMTEHKHHSVLYTTPSSTINQPSSNLESTSTKMATSIFTRKADLIYLIFFLTHLVVMFNVDLYPLWPVQIRPAYMDTLRKWYITTYRDQFFVSPPWVLLLLFYNISKMDARCRLNHCFERGHDAVVRE